MSKKETPQQAKLLERDPAEVLAKHILEDPVRTTAQMHQLLHQEFGMETPEERSLIIEKAVELAKTRVRSTGPSGPTGETPKPPQTPPAPEQPKAVVLPQALSENKQAAEARALGFINTQLWNSMALMAKTFSESGALPANINTAQKLMVVLQAGYEAGMQPIQSINSFYLVNGKVSMYGDALISQVIRAGHRVEFSNSTATECTCKIIRGDNGQDMAETVKIADIPQRVRSKGGPWQDYPKRMLKYKAFAEVAHFIVPEALQGIAIKEDIEEIEEGKETGHRAPRVERTVKQTPRQHRPLSEVLEGSGS